MIKVKSESDKRIIIKGRLNGNEACLMVDTGAVVGILDEKACRKFKLDVRKDKRYDLVSASGKFKAYLCLTPFEIGDVKTYQFAVGDIGGVVKSVENETGISICGLLSLRQCKAMNISIDTDEDYITVGK